MTPDTERFSLSLADGDRRQREDDEVRAASLQFVRKVSVLTKPSAASQDALDRAVAQVTENVRELLSSLVTGAPPRSRAIEVARKREQSGARAWNLDPDSASTRGDRHGLSPL